MVGDLASAACAVMGCLRLEHLCEALLVKWLSSGSSYRPGIFASLIGAEPILCTPPCPLLVDEQALTSRPASSSADAAIDMVIFFFIGCFPVCCFFGTHFD